MSKKRILYLTFYFEPDLCAGSFRNSPVAKELGERFDGEIDIITTLPNRYSTYSADAPEYEERGNLRIHRIALPAHQSGMLDQMKSFRKFYRQAKKIASDKSYNLVFASSSRLFTAYLGARIARQMKLPLYLDIRDIFIETIQDVVKNPVFRALGIPILQYLEKITFSTANHINLVSGGFKAYFEPKYKTNYTYFTNGIDEVFIDAGKEKVAVQNPTPVLLYAGNFGESQGLHSIIPDFAELVGDEVRIKLIGDGGAKKRLSEEVTRKNLSNVELHPPLPRKELIKEYQKADILFVHLNDYPAFKRVLPSKIFEYGAFNKPVLAGVGGFCAQLLKEDMAFVEVFSPCDSKAMAEAYYRLLKIDQPVERLSYIDKYRRKNLVDKMVASILEYVR